MRSLGLTIGAMLALCASIAGARAQDYPNRTIRMVVPYAPGGGVSILGQIVGNKMSEILKQPIVIDNRPGAGGNLGADIVAKSPPDGYTILLHTSAMSSASSLYGKLPFDTVKDFVPVSMVISTQFVIAGSPKTAAADLRELATLAKDKPGALNFGSSGPGSSLHIFAEMFNSIAGTKMVHIPYRGDAPMVTALIGGDIQLAFLPQANGIANVQSNLIRGLGVTGTKRMDALPNVPTALEQGFKGLEVGSWNAMFVPAGTPPAVVNAIQQALAKTLADPKVREVLVQTGQEPVGDTPEAFAATFKADIARFAKVVEAAKIPKLD
ncbi:MAG: tripartite tricarboxylate transporter substrate binding protein [Xanthobacteraceae bacterium]|nr:tripartite tricarboxylate transporter substrate binding protein [Xanthobacteraceae bacterium]